MRIDDLVERYAPMMYRLAYLLTSDHQTAEDVCQEVFLAACRHLGAIREPKAWLARATVNRARNVLRGRARRREDALDDAVADPDGDPAARYEVTDVVAAIAALPPAHREMLLLVYYQGFTAEEAARILGVPAATARSRLHRARNALRRQLEAIPDGPDPR